MENEVLKAIRERRSVRKYKSEQIRDDELQAVLEAGTWSPTGMGNQDPYIVAVQNKALRDRLMKMNADVMGVSSDPYYGAPTIVLVFASADWANNVKDGSLVLGTMMLAAHAVGLASCWINREDAMFESAEGKAIMKDLNLPEGLVGIGALALGYADGAAHAPKPRKKDYFRVIK
jgi:nitroreductase